MTEAIGRVVERNPAMDLGTMAMILSGVPRPVDRTDAIAVMPGLGETWRVADAVQAWEASSVARHLLVMGTNSTERTHVPATLENLSEPPVNLRRHEGVHIQPHALNTPDQAGWLADRAEELEVTSMSLFVSPYHLLRAYCTTLKTFAKRGERIPLIPVPVAVSPNTLIPETEADAWDVASGEAARMVTYQERGDVATLPELKDYLAWLCEQPIVADLLVA